MTSYTTGVQWAAFFHLVFREYQCKISTNLHYPRPSYSWGNLSKNCKKSIPVNGLPKCLGTPNFTILFFRYMGLFFVKTIFFLVCWILSIAFKCNESDKSLIFSYAPCKHYFYRKKSFEAMNYVCRSMNVHELLTNPNDRHDTTKEANVAENILYLT
jgi:hypothetical protein